MPGLSVYNKCNNNCIMCSNPDDFWAMDEGLFSLNKLTERIQRFYRGERVFLSDYRDSFSITGGEPTLSAYLFSVIKSINEFFPRIRIICLTNGRMFSRTDYAKEFLRLSANLELAVSLHGHNARVHDKITQTPGSFDQAVAGLKNIFRLRKHTQHIGIRVVVHGLNYKFLEKITRFIMINFPQVDYLVFMFFEIEGQAARNLVALKLTYTRLFPYIDKIYDFIAVFPQVRFYHFPLCTLPSKFYPYIWRTLPDVEVSFPKNCKNCKLRGLCLGIHKGYLEYIGPDEFHPFESSINIQESGNWHRPIAGVDNPEF